MSSASSGRSFLEAVRFSASLLGLHGLQQDRVPQRVSGLAEMLARKATTLKQASPLSVLQVSKLEELCCTSDSINDRAIIGGILTMLYSCARASDAARVVQLVIDRVQCGEGDIPADGIAGYIEAGALHTKGARSQVHKRSLLPLVAPMAGVSGWRWWDSFLQAREALGLQIEGKLSCPLMCRFDEQGQAVPAALQASEIGCFLRNVLKIPHEKTNAIRSHSLKVTPLSWTAKAGSSLAIRRSLGHHLDTNARSATIYARDAMAPPLRELCRVIQLIEKSSSQTTPAVDVSERRWKPRKWLPLPWTQGKSPRAPTRCPFRSVLLVTRNRQTLMRHQTRMPRSRTVKFWTQQHFGTWWSRSTGQTWSRQRRALTPGCIASPGCCTWQQLRADDLSADAKPPNGTLKCLQRRVNALDARHATPTSPS